MVRGPSMNNLKAIVQETEQFISVLDKCKKMVKANRNKDRMSNT